VKLLIGGLLRLNGFSAGRRKRMFNSFHNENSQGRSTLNRQLLFLLYGGATRRFHTVPLLKEITDSQHQWGVAHLCYLIAEEPTLNLIMAALSHDMAEQTVGDIPAPTKRALELTKRLGQLEDAVLEAYGYLFPLTAEEQEILKLADYLEGMLSCVHERGLGNRFVEVVYSHWRLYFTSTPVTQLNAVRIFTAIEGLWSEALGKDMEEVKAAYGQ
jgi:5'-deoxynucleotidase YfbR-like HD superfamily hydrolase